MFKDSGVVLFGGVAFVTSEAVLGVDFVELFHGFVASDFCED